jgi:hypothetical protein
VLRAKRNDWPLPSAPAPPAEDPSAIEANNAQHSRVYDCSGALEAFAVWCLWLMQLNQGKLDKETDLHDFILELFAWKNKAV